jgi:hypothetical protein
MLFGDKFESIFDEVTLYMLVQWCVSEEGRCVVDFQQVNLVVVF